MVPENQHQPSLSNELGHEKPRDWSPAFNRVMYTGFIVMSGYFLIRGQILDAASNLAIALIFDPFDQKIRWQQRPLIQRSLLIVHVLVVFILFAWGFSDKF